MGEADYINGREYRWVVASFLITLVYRDSDFGRRLLDSLQSLGVCQVDFENVKASICS